MANKKHVLITGGTRGIGAACVRRFFAAGYDTAAVYRADDEAARRLFSELCPDGRQNDNSLVFIKADISDPASAQEAYARAVRQTGEPDILVNCAGVADIRLFTDTSDADWRRIIDTNLTSAFTLARAAAPAMIRRGWGRIINIGSVWGRLGASCEVAYSASKAGLRGMSAAMAKELGPSGITVNCVEPGVIDTDMNSHLTAEDITALCDSTPLCRLGRPDEVAAAVMFLASNDAAFITGAAIPVDGGFPA